MSKVVVDHGDRVLLAGEGPSFTVMLRLFTPAGYNDVILQPEELAPLIELLQTSVAHDAEARLTKKDSTLQDLVAGLGSNFVMPSGGSGA